MDCWTLFFSGLSAIAAFGLLICTIIGFWFICKQTAIAKNKDTFFRFQAELMQEIKFYLHQHVTFKNELIELIDKYSKEKKLEQ